MSLYDYERWPNFTKEELVCRHTGKENPNDMLFTPLMDAIQHLRDWYGWPMTVTSAYRHPTHPREVKKEKPGMHTLASIDIQVPAVDCHMILKKAFEMGFTGIGVNLKGEHKDRFIHLDFRPAPWVWSY